MFVRDREKESERVLVFLWRCEILMETSSRYRMLMVFFLSLKQASLLWALLVLLFILKLWLCLMDVFTCISALRRLWGNVSSISINYMQKSGDGCNFAWQTTTHELRQRCERAQRLQIDFPCFSPIESEALQLVSSELVLWGKMLWLHAILFEHTVQSKYMQICFDRSLNMLIIHAVFYLIAPQW